MSDDDMYFRQKLVQARAHGYFPKPAGLIAQTFKLVFWILLGIFIAGFAFAVWAIISNVHAQDPDTRWVRENLLSECKRRGTCWRYLHPHRYEWWPSNYYRPFYRPRWEPDRERVYSWRYDREDRDDDYRYNGHCRPIMIATGHEAGSRPVAKEEGEQAWMEEVRSKWGARYMDPRNAHDLSYECYRSSTGNRATEKLRDVAGAVLEQCRVEAKPCRAEREYADDESERTESRNLKENDERGSRLFRKFQQWRRNRGERLDRGRR